MSAVSSMPKMSLKTAAVRVPWGNLLLPRLKTNGHALKIVRYEQIYNLNNIANQAKKVTELNIYCIYHMKELE